MAICLLPVPMKWIFPLLFLLLGFEILAQDPYYFTLGKDELSALDIYSIGQTDDEIYWIATNDGLYSYDGYEFRKLNHPDILGNSLFYLKKDYEGNIYCNNLNGQIFRIYDGQMELFHTVPDSLLNVYTHFNFLPSNQIVVCSKSCYKPKPTGNEVLFKEGVGNFSSRMIVKNGNGKLLIQKHKAIIREVSETETREVFITGGAHRNNPDYISLHHRNDKLFARIINDSDILLNISTDKNSFRFKKILSQPDSLARLYFTRNHFWFANQNQGIRRLDIPDSDEFSESKQPPNPILKNTFISAVFEDKSGNILLGTFGKGVIVIPKSGMANHFSEEENLTKIALYKNGDLLLGDLLGNVYQYGNGLKSKINSTSQKAINFLEYFPENGHIFYMSNQLNRIDSKGNAFDKEISAGSVKNMLAQDSGYILATSFGLKLLGLESVNDITAYKHKLGRTYAVCKTEKGQIIVGTSTGLKLLNKEGYLVGEIQFEGKSIISTQLESTEAGVLASSQKQGLLKFSEGKISVFSKHISSETLAGTTQFRVKKGRVYVATKSVFFILDLEGNLLKKIGLSDGLKSNQLKDFEVDDKQIWFLHQFGLQSFLLSEIDNRAEEIRLKELVGFANDVRFSDSENSKLAYDKNRISFKIFAPSLTFQQDLRYKYRLKGIDQEWNSQNYQENYIEYKSLPSGNYEFQISLELKGKRQDYQTMKFSIGKPFWQTWWFFAVSVVLSVALVTLYFRKRLDSLKQRAEEIEELNASKLVALQSQLNPHFVFNAIGSIQSFMLNKDAVQASDYMTKFSGLMRQVLSHSRQTHIPLSEEIEMIEKYIQLQKLYSEKDFTYEIEISEQLNEQETFIPPMFVQPFVENAIEHGIHKEDGKVKISFEIIKNTILISITDNGIGISVSKNRKKDESSDHVSMAIAIIEERIYNFNKQSTENISIEVSDRIIDGKISGTRVELKLPIHFGLN